MSGSAGRTGSPVRVDIAAGVERYVKTSDGFPQYAYGLLQAAFLASGLSYPSVAALELGVAGGNGLLELERLAAAIGGESGLDIEVSGFDLGTGMPLPLDHRDMPYIWQRGFFTMDEPLIRSRLTSARLILGDIAGTGNEFIATSTAPVGFISFDFDYYSSTVAAMRALLDADPEHYLPRVLCYFDDTVGPHEELHSEFTGEMLAIREFNDAHPDRKIAKINGLGRKLPDETEPWVEGMYVLHIFDHPRYNDYVFPAADRQFPLDR
jgi:hypothetical protein